MNKRIVVHLIDMDRAHNFSYEDDRYINETFYSGTITRNEYPNICLGYKITEEKLSHAIDTLITYFMQAENHSIIVDLDERNDKLAPVKEMTITDLLMLSIILKIGLYGENRKNR